MSANGNTDLIFNDPQHGETIFTQKLDVVCSIYTNLKLSTIFMNAIMHLVNVVKIYKKNLMSGI